MMREVSKVRLLAQLAGEGLEIGALDRPQAVPGATRVRYVDVYTSEQGAALYTESVDGGRAVHVDIVARAEQLAAVPDQSQDFLIASHVLEHIKDPIQALVEWRRILRAGGHLLLVLPDKRETFDRDRERTPLDHVIADFRQDPTHPERRRRDRAHYESWSSDVNGLVVREQIEFWANLLEDSEYPIHFHCWTPPDIEEIVAWISANTASRFELADREVEDRAGEFAHLYLAV